MSIPYTQLQLQQLLNTKNIDLKNAQKSFQKTQSRLCFNTKTETRHGTCRIDHCFPFFSLLSWGPEWNRSAKSVKSVKSKRCYTLLKYNTKMSYKIHLSLSCIVYLYYIFVFCKYISLHVHTKSIAPQVVSIISYLFIPRTSLRGESTISKQWNMFPHLQVLDVEHGNPLNIDGMEMHQASVSCCHMDLSLQSCLKKCRILLFILFVLFMLLVQLMRQ